MSQEPISNEAMQTNDEDATRAAIAEAIARRAPTQTRDDDEERQFAIERDSRITFRRLLDPGIARHVQPATFESTLKMISMIANNLLSDPDNEKYRRFKPTNTLIKKNLVEVKGALEYVVELGFRAEVVNFQPYYTFLATPRNWDNLRIGTAVLAETMERMQEKAEQAKLNRVDPKAVQREIALKVKLAYEDDRKEKKRRDEIEKQAREGRAARAAAAKANASRTGAVPSSPNATSTAQEDHEEDDEALMSPMPMPIPALASGNLRMSLRGGHTLRGDPPPYNQPEEPEASEDTSHDT